MTNRAAFTQADVARAVRAVVQATGGPVAVEMENGVIRIVPYVAGPKPAEPTSPNETRRLG